ncbi:GNAT family N-acetyltransferase [Devosia insulae]|uniref:GNAT family N-acetyltransferase n=1 Tax=Devosia insulae TaxID=408174 RepID=UPI001FCD20EE|nr:GNAT family N-acetyltransferase [Devosia insulae]
MIVIRPAAPADAAAMSAVLTASIRDLCTADHRADPEILAGWLRNKTPEMVLKMLERPGAQFLVAERDGEIAAVGCLTGPDEIGLNYVAPAHRFAGVSKAMLAALEDRIRQAGADIARLTSTGTAHRFYLANGWQDAGPAEADRGMLCYPMEKRL